MRNYFFIPVLVLFPLAVMSQTSISGIINSYHKVIEVIPSKSCVRVSSVAGLYANDRLMIIQMKGATVNITNTASFGTVTAMNNAGFYEIATLCRVVGDTVFLVQDLLNTYSVNDKVQLVRIPQYENAIVTDSLKAAPWDSTAGTGGVLALTVYNNLILSASVSALRTGFRGGAYLTSNNTCSNLTAPTGYFYDPTTLAPQSGACKGESITDPGLPYRGGKGALASGGGGGNNHNNGGGGGANAGAGGIGGSNSSTSACTAANPGRGGNALDPEGGSRIFPGGGGAAGHANSGMASIGGGRGGGILFIQAHTIHTNGHKFLATGQKGGNTIGDGASGGGGGGTIIFDVNNFIGLLVADASGGDGGNESDDNTSGKCYGEGGGGGGGAIYFKAARPPGTITANGGAKGLKQHFISCTPVLATAGTAGTINEFYSYRHSLDLAAYCGQLTLPVRLLSFDIEKESNAAYLKWQLGTTPDVKEFILERKQDNAAWREIRTISYSMQQNNYGYADRELVPGRYQYRLKFIGPAGNYSYSEIRELQTGFTSSRLVLYPNPASAIVNLIHPFNTGDELKIFDGLGRLVLHKKIGTPLTYLQLDITILKKGIFRVVIGQFSAALVVQ